MSLIKIGNFVKRIKLPGWKRFKHDTRGVSAIEFALIAPVMVIIYFGGIELSLLMQADRRITTISATIGDLASREASLTGDDIDDIFAAAAILANPLDATNLQMRISSLVSDANGTVTVLWSEPTGNFTDRPDGQIITDIPPGVIDDNQSVILAEVEFFYQPEVDYSGFGSRTLRDTFYLRPRRTNIVTFDNN